MSEHCLRHNDHARPRKEDLGNAAKYPLRMIDHVILSHARETAGLSQAHLARILKVAPSHVSRVERGLAKLSIDQLDRWLDVCGLKLAAVGERDLSNALARCSKEDQEFLANFIDSWASLPESHRAQLRSVVAALMAAWLEKKV